MLAFGYRYLLICYHMANFAFKVEISFDDITFRSAPMTCKGCIQMEHMTK